MAIDTIGDFLTIIRNATMVGKPSAVVFYSKIRYAISQILKNEGFIKDFLVQGSGVEKTITLFFKYINSESVIHEISRVSTPGKRVYSQAKNIKPVVGGLGIVILTTNQGVITNKEVRNRHVGGEVICTVW
jgi:small subunit ribosomal protein S8